MPNQIESFATLLPIAYASTGIVIVGAALLARRFRDSDSALFVLSLLACLTSACFGPLWRRLPEELAFIAFVAGIGPVVFMLILALAASFRRLLQGRRIWSGMSLLLSLIAVMLFVVNF